MYQDKEVTTDLSELYSEVNRVYEIGEKGDLCGSDEIDLQLFETEDFDIEYDHIEQSLFVGASLETEPNWYEDISILFSYPIYPEYDYKVPLTIEIKKCVLENLRFSETFIEK